MMELQQYTHGHRLDYAVIQHMQRQLGVCSKYIDLLNAVNYRGKRYMRQGRIFIPLTHPHHRCIIIDKNHTTRYLVQQIITTTSQQTTANQAEEFYMQIFEGYKYEPHKYLIHGTFHLFEMHSYHSYIGFDEIDLTCPRYQHLASENIRKKENIGEVLFCKVADKGLISYYYFDRELKRIKETQVKLPRNDQSSDYFSYDMTEKTLHDLLFGNDVSTKVLSYFFDRLTYAYYSQSWFREPLKHVKVFKPHFIVPFFHQQSKGTIDCSFFNQQLLKVYSLIGKCIFSQQRLIVFPIFQRKGHHFDLGAIYSAEDNTIHVFELDPLDAEGIQGGWRQKLKLLIGQNANLILKKIIACQIKAEIIHHTNISDISAPRQRQTPDCAIYICLYTLLLMEKYGFLELSEEVKARCKGDAATTELIGFMRKFIYNSYMSKEGYLLPAFQNKFAETFANNYP